jgi:hypothetical protein
MESASNLARRLRATLCLLQAARSLDASGCADKVKKTRQGAGMEIDQNELKRAIARLTEDPPERATPVCYRNPLQVVREEWHGRTYGNIDNPSKANFNANHPQLESLNAPPSVVVAEESDEESFRQAERQWQRQSGTR